MKKTSFIFACVLLAVFCFSSVSYSENKDYDLLCEYGYELYTNSHKTANNETDFLNVTKTTKTFDETNICDKITEVGYLLLWSHDLISYFLETYNEQSHSNTMIINRLTGIQKNIKTELDYINKMYGFIKVVSLLHILDKQRNIIRLSLETLDKTIKLMKKMDKDMKKKTKKPL